MSWTEEGWEERIYLLLQEMEMREYLSQIRKKTPEEVLGLEKPLEGRELRCIYRKDGELLVGYCREIPEAMTQGKDLRELIENMRDVISLTLEDYGEDEIQQIAEEGWEEQPFYL